jgi:hypothetical protein
MTKLSTGKIHAEGEKIMIPRYSMMIQWSQITSSLPQKFEVKIFAAKISISPIQIVANLKFAKSFPI